MFGHGPAHDVEIEPHATQSREEVTQKPRHAPSIVLALVVGLMVAACNSETATTEDPGEPVTTTTAAASETTAAAEDGDVDPLSQGLPGEVSAGDTVETPNLGGLRFVVGEDRSIYQSPGFIAIEQPGPAEILLVRVAESLSGEPIDSVDAVIALIDEATITLDELDPVTIAGLETRVFDLTAEPNPSPRPDDAIFRMVEGGVGGWGPAGEARVWLLDTPRGIMLFSAGILEPGAADLADVIAEAEAIFATLEL